MKARKVVVSVELLTNMPVKELKQYVVNKLNDDTDNYATVEVKQIQINVVKK